MEKKRCRDVVKLYLHKKKAFTLVELIVVITILAILSTIGFVSFSGYLAGTRDTNRIAQLKSMSDALELYRTKKDLPIPDDKVNVMASGSLIAYQGYIGKNVLETIEYTESGLDPKDKKYFTYFLTKNKKYFQLMAFLEEPNEDEVAINNFPKTFATDYSERIPKTTGKKLGILTNIDNNPIQEVNEVTASGYLDIENTTEEYNAIFKDSDRINGTGSILKILSVSTRNKNPNSCKEIIKARRNQGSQIYTIEPVINNSFEVYCDMVTDGGGWMRIITKNPIVDFEKISSRTSGIFANSKCKHSSDEVYCNYNQVESADDYGFNKEIDFNIPINYTELIYKIKIDPEQSNDLGRFNFSNTSDSLIFHDGSDSGGDNNVYTTGTSIGECKDWCKGKMNFLSTNGIPKLIWTDYREYVHQKTYIDYIMVR